MLGDHLLDIYKILMIMRLLYYDIVIPLKIFYEIVFAISLANTFILLNQTT